ncbi:EAL domain-containing protein [Scandinavium sp. V105_16]|uniref:diguanylate cyclase n=1 Tax=Scandinavium lactucae TaxID=3095028 RepID=A0AAJ2S8E5_9ENTR|nr:MULTISPECIES: EAL domain-containing protein [unclassified Scandinavium]MDX6022414.1 EAL domain-containing protein [Scandinavium sp. V105_16]MDX6033744.1 EAL domain-containing protein [Scandinavium sp. V105_12]MDX6042408.1 EAL domain-containing protein [Scandinavium sp. V105_6]MDX6052409.1 EAL domain-containing protein [Scandinavium sp. V105_1]
MLYVSWDPVLVGISFLVAFISSFVALDSAAKIAACNKNAALFWRFAGGATLGIGIWSMHFIGMLAMKMPMMMQYDFTLTTISLLVAIVAATLSINIAVNGNVLSLLRLCLATAILSSGVVTMHYVGMAALMMEDTIRWSYGLVVLSVVIAIIASGVGLWLAFRLRLNSKGVLINRMMAAVAMGIAIAAMHYTGMSAAEFEDSGHYMNGGVSELGLSIWVSATTLAILGVMLIISMIDSQLRTHRLTENLQQLNRQLEQQARFDGLTGLANRSQIDMRLEACLQQSQLTQTPFALIFMDLDRFKLVNDAWGHHVGDHLLVSVANRISACLTPKMTLARLGGDEFILLVPDADHGDIEDLATRMVECIRRPFYEAGQMLQVSLSAGISLFPEHGRTLQELKLRADTAMYNIKQQGRNGWAIYHPEMVHKAWEGAEFLQDLTQALERDQFELWYQPKYHARSKTIFGFEALLRWRHPAKGVLLPEVFLATLEKTGLMISVGYWVIDQACMQLRHWGDQGHTDWGLSINLSAAQFEQHDIYDTICGALARHAVPPSRLTIELTESTALRNLDRSITILNDFNRIGITVSIDDFGTGYSNMLTLKNLPARELKIDKSFVRDIRDNSKNVKIVATIIDIAHSMNMNVVAEGIETQDQQQLLTSLGCGYLQGFLFAKALPAKEIPQLLAQIESSKNNSVTTVLAAVQKNRLT